MAGAEILIDDTAEIEVSSAMGNFIARGTTGSKTSSTTGNYQQQLRCLSEIRTTTSSLPQFTYKVTLR